MYVLIGILLLGILIAVHEFGHFIAARICGIEVMEFAIGMGPKLIGWTGKSGTKFSLRCIPLGGFCAFYGEDDVEGKTKDDPRAYSKQNVWKRIFTVAMGPMMNFVLALVVAFGFFFFLGENTTIPVVDALMEGYASRIEKLNEVLKDKDILMCMYNANAVSLMDTESALNILVSSLGGKNIGETVGEQNKSTHGEEASWETIIKLNPEYMFILDRSSATQTSDNQVIGVKEVIEAELAKYTDYPKHM